MKGVDEGAVGGLTAKRDTPPSDRHVTVDTPRQTAYSAEYERSNERSKKALEAEFDER